MRGDKPGNGFVSHYLPNGFDTGVAAIRRFYRPHYPVPYILVGFPDFADFVVSPVSFQGGGKDFPPLGMKAETEKEIGFVGPVRVGRIQQVVGNFPAGDARLLGIGQFHGPALSYGMGRFGRLPYIIAAAFVKERGGNNKVFPGRLPLSRRYRPPPQIQDAVQHPDAAAVEGISRNDGRRGFGFHRLEDVQQFLDLRNA